MLLFLGLSILAAGALSRRTGYSAATPTETHIDLTPYLNNKAAALEGHIANFDGHNGSYPAEYLPPEGLFSDQGVSVSTSFIPLSSLTFLIPAHLLVFTSGFHY